MTQNSIPGISDPITISVNLVSRTVSSVSVTRTVSCNDVLRNVEAI